MPKEQTSRSTVNPSKDLGPFSLGLLAAVSPSQCCSDSLLSLPLAVSYRLTSYNIDNCWDSPVWNIEKLILLNYSHVASLWVIHMLLTDPNQSMSREVMGILKKQKLANISKSFPAWNFLSLWNMFTGISDNICIYWTSAFSSHAGGCELDESADHKDSVSLLERHTVQAAVSNLLLTLTSGILAL